MAIPPMKVSRGARRLYTLIEDFIHRSGSFFASQPWIAKRLNTSTRSVQRWTAELLDKGYVFHSCGKQRSATYRILRELPPIMAAQKPLEWRVIGGSLAGHLKEDSFTSLRERDFPSERLKAVAPAALDATDRLASKNLKSKIAQLVRSGNLMPVPKLPPVPERLRDAVRHASGDYR
jgi:hypothetical protein